MQEKSEVKGRQSEVLPAPSSTPGPCHVCLSALPFNPLLFDAP